MVSTATDRLLPKRSKPKESRRKVRTAQGGKPIPIQQRVTDARGHLLLLIAEQSLEILKQGLQSRHEQAFKDVLDNARINNVACDADVAILGSTTRPNASRWMHGSQFPGVPTQEKVLLGIARMAEHRWRNLRAGRDEEDGMDVGKIGQISYPELDKGFDR